MRTVPEGWPASLAFPPNLFRHPQSGIYFVKKCINGRTQKLTTGKQDPRQALRRYHEIMKAWNDGESGWTTAVAVPTFAEYWVESYRPAFTVRKTQNRSGTYLDDYLIRTALQVLGPHPLTAITNTMCQKLANVRRGQFTERRDGSGTVVVRRPITEGTVTRELALVQGVLAQAVEDGHLVKNPMRKVARERQRTKERVLSHEEQQRLLAALSPRYQRWLIVMLGTGLRVQEACGIRPVGDLNLAARTVRVTRKTHGLRKREQVLPLFADPVIEALQQQLDAEGQLWPANQANIRQALQLGCRKAGIPLISPHTLRHTFATRYLQAGGDIYKLSLLLGHSTVATTEKVYAHLLGEDLGAASKGLDLGLVARNVAQA